MNTRFPFTCMHTEQMLLLEAFFVVHEPHVHNPLLCMHKSTDNHIKQTALSLCICCITIWSTGPHLVRLLLALLLLLLFLGAVCLGLALLHMWQTDRLPEGVDAYIYA
jgi:hypothetical protein